VGFKTQNEEVAEKGKTKPNQTGPKNNPVETSKP